LLFRRASKIKPCKIGFHKRCQATISPFSGTALRFGIAWELVI
jgi:hypothetical protein